MGEVEGTFLVSTFGLRDLIYWELVSTDAFFISLVMWYTNPQTEAFCQLIGVENKVNPVPKQ